VTIKEQLMDALNLAVLKDVSINYKAPGIAYLSSKILII